jgi:hypothetical protein
MKLFLLILVKNNFLKLVEDMEIVIVMNILLEVLNNCIGTQILKIVINHVK